MGDKRNTTLGRGDDLNILLRRGRRLSHPFFLAVWRPGRGPRHRLVCIISRSVDRRATVRNRLRRRISGFIRVHGAYINPPLDIAVICRREAADATRSRLYAALKEILLRLP